MAKIITDAAARARRIWLPIAGVGSVALWLWVARAMPTSNRLDHVGLFILAFALLFTLYFVAVRAVSGSAGRGRDASPGPARGERRALALVLGFAVVFRLLAVLAGLPAERPLAALAADLSGDRVAYEPFLLYDNDLWRYLWDGHTLAEGFDPYRVTPQRAAADDELARRLLASESWRDVHGAVSFRNYGTIYPPAIHLFFAALARLAPASAGAARLALAAIDLVLCLLLVRVLAAAGSRRELVVAYAWNPAAIKEIAGSGHPDVLMMLALVGGAYLLARGRGIAGGAALAVSVLAKLASVVTLPLLAAWTWARRGRATTAQAALGGGVALALGLWPFAGGLGAWREAFAVFAERWTFNSGPWAAARRLFELLGAAEPATAAHWLTRAAIVLLALWLARRGPASATGSDREAMVVLFRGLFLALAALVLLSPAVMPWYLLWALPAAVVAGNRWWPAFTGLAMLSYLSYAETADGESLGTWWKWVEYGLLAVVVLWDHRRSTTEPARFG